MNLVYTAIYGGYDKLWQPKQRCEGWDYRCYTDRNIEGGEWKIIDDKLKGYDDARASKFIKIMHPMAKYDTILWIDGCVEIIGDLNEFIAGLPDGDIVVGEHPINKTLDEELKACIMMNKDDEQLMKSQVESYGNVQHIFPQNTIIVRRKDIKATDIWWHEVKTKSKRDQLSFGWAMQQAKQKYSTFPWAYTQKYFVWHKFHDK